MITYDSLLQRGYPCDVCGGEAKHVAQGQDYLEYFCDNDKPAQVAFSVKEPEVIVKTQVITQRVPGPSVTTKQRSGIYGLPYKPKKKEFTGYPVRGFSR